LIGIRYSAHRFLGFSILPPSLPAPGGFSFTPQNQNRMLRGYSKHPVISQPVEIGRLRTFVE
jgi:hypothetical protein